MIMVGSVLARLGSINKARGTRPEPQESRDWRQRPRRHVFHADVHRRCASGGLQGQPETNIVGRQPVHGIVAENHQRAPWVPGDDLKGFEKPDMQVRIPGFGTGDRADHGTAISFPENCRDRVFCILAVCSMRAMPDFSRCLSLTLNASPAQNAIHKPKAETGTEIDVSQVATKPMPSITRFAVLLSPERSGA